MLELVDQLSWARSISSCSWPRHIGSETENKEEVSECMKNEQLQGVKEVKKGIEVKKEVWYI